MKNVNIADSGSGYNFEDGNLIKKNKAYGYLTNKSNKLKNIILYRDINLIGKSESSHQILNVSVIIYF